LAASIRLSNKFPLAIATFCKLARAIFATLSLRLWKAFKDEMAKSFSSLVLRITSCGITVGLPFGSKKVLKPIKQII
jgi:hypothetical protein